jgi:hypothetical protein
MSLWLSVVVALAAGGEQSLADKPVVKQPQELRNAIRDVMAGEAQAKTPAARADAVRELCKLYGEVLEHPTLIQEERLRLRALVWARLTKTKTEVANKLARDRKAAELAQRRAIREGQAAPAAATSQSQQTAYALAGQMDLVSRSLGGPAAIVASSGGAFGGGPGTDDYGDELIDLIQRTIAPTTWDINGGPGSIVYYRHLHALVVSATSEVHDDFGNVLENLRRVGP